MKTWKTLVTMAAMLALTLALAVGAHAQPAGNGTTAKKGCSVNLQGPNGSPGQTVVYDHGYSFSVVNRATGKTHTYKCNDGKWEETVSRRASRALERFTYTGALEMQATEDGRPSPRRMPTGERTSVRTSASVR